MLPRYLEVDPSLSVVAGSTYSTIQAAVNYAASQGASDTSRWTVMAGAANYTEDLDIPVGVTLRGQGMRSTFINGQLKFHPGAHLSDFYVNSPATNGFGMQYVNDVNGSLSSYVHNVKVFASGVNGSGPISAIELVGGATGGGFLQVMGCYFYSKNNYTGANVGGVSKMACIRLDSTFVAYGEFFGCHFKSSGGATGTTQPILLLNETVSPATLFGYAQIAASDYEDVHGDNGTTPHPMLIKSSSIVHEGGMIDVGYLNVYSQVMPTISIAYTGPFASSVLYTQAFNVARTRGQLYRNDLGVDYPIVPTLNSVAAPTVGDVAPDGTEWIRR